MKGQHSVQAMVRARELAAAGWHDAAIVRLLADEGISVTKTTVRRWVDPEYDERRRVAVNACNRERRAQGARLRLTGQTDEYKFARLCALRAVGISHTQIGRVMELDFGESWPRDRVVLALKSGRIPKRYRKRVAA